MNTEILDNGWSVEGYVEGNLIFVVRYDRKKPRITISSTMPSNFDQAKVHMNVMSQVMALAESKYLGALTSTPREEW